MSKKKYIGRWVGQFGCAWTVVGCTLAIQKLGCVWDPNDTGCAEGR